MTKHDLKVAYGVGSVFLGYMAGPAVVSGAWAVSYFAKYGANGLWLPLITCAFVGLILYMGLDLARSYNTHDFGTYSSALYGKYRKIGNKYFTLMMLVVAPVSMAGQFSLGATLINVVIDCNYYVACIIAFFIMLLFMLWGSKLVRITNSVMSAMLIVVCVVIMAFTFKDNGARFGEIISNWEVWTDSGSLLYSIFLAFVMGSSCAVNVTSVITVSEELKTRKQCALAAIISALLFFLLLLITILVVLPYAPESLVENSPILYVVNNFLGKYLSILPGLYTLLLVLAVLTSGPSIMLGQAKRYGKLLHKETGILSSEKVCFTIVSIIFCFISIFIGKVGLLALMGTVYVWIGYANFPLVHIPTLLVGKRIRQHDADVAAGKVKVEDI